MITIGALRAICEPASFPTCFGTLTCKHDGLICADICVTVNQHCVLCLSNANLFIVALQIFWAPENPLSVSKPLSFDVHSLISRTITTRLERPFAIFQQLAEFDKEQPKVVNVRQLGVSLSSTLEPIGPRSGTVREFEKFFNTASWWQRRRTGEFYRRIARLSLFHPTKPDAGPMLQLIRKPVLQDPRGTWSIIDELHVLDVEFYDRSITLFRVLVHTPQLLSKIGRTNDARLVLDYLKSIRPEQLGDKATFIPRVNRMSCCAV